MDYSIAEGIHLAPSLHLRRIPPRLVVAVADIPKDITLPWAGQVDILKDIITHLWAGQADILKDVAHLWAGQVDLPLFGIQPHRQVPTLSKQSCAHLTP